MSALQIQIGDIIRAYDFKPMIGRDDCYIEGRVIDRDTTQQGYRAYRVVVTRDHFGDDEVSTQPGPDSRVGLEMYVPYRVSFMEYPGRIINLSRI